MAQTLTHFPNSFWGVEGGEPIHTLKALIGLGQCAKNNDCHPSIVKTNEGVLESKCMKQNWSHYDLENETAHVSHFIVNRYEKIQKSTRVLYVILEFLRKLLVKVRPSYEHFDSYMSLGKCNFMLSYISILNQQQNTLEQLPANESVFTITRENYETTLLVLVKETQLYLLPDIFLELEQDKLTMVAKHFSGDIFATVYHFHGYKTRKDELVKPWLFNFLTCGMLHCCSFFLLQAQVLMY